ncbi:MAG: hypothetical protein P4L64_04780 [Caulobacteraceae bacterium]|nr:hypothetical protein [Caulobacteraceae bacterium]
MNRCSYDIKSAWPGLVESPAQIGEKFLRTLDALGRIDPIFKDWGTSNEDNSPKGRPIESLRPNFTSFVETRTELDGWDQPDPAYGYWLWATTGYYPYAPPNPFSMTFSVTAGCEWRNYNSLEAGRNILPPDPSNISFPVFRAALLTMLAIWPAPWANARAYYFRHDPPTQPGEPPFPQSGYQMPWLSYLCAERAARITVPDSIPTERTPDGGLLMIAAQTRFDPNNREHMARSRILAEIMIEHGGDPIAG